jgi:RNA polymerase sigma-54 factor
MINLQQQLKLGLRLTPQQVQYLKLLQLPTLSLEQRIKLELELNPMLELNEEQELSSEEEERAEETTEEVSENSNNDDYTIEDYINDDLAGFKSPEAYKSNDEDDSYEPPLPSVIPLTERLLSQLRMNVLDDEESLLAEEILGNVDGDGYLRRDLALIVQDLNLSYGLTIAVEKAEQVLQKILLLDPPGIAARNLQECLIAQLQVGKYAASLKELAIKTLTSFFEDFKLKRFDNLERNLNIRAHPTS